MIAVYGSYGPWCPLIPKPGREIIHDASFWLAVRQLPVIPENRHSRLQKAASFGLLKISRMPGSDASDEWSIQEERRLDSMPNRLRDEVQRPTGRFRCSEFSSGCSANKYER